MIKHLFADLLGTTLNFFRVGTAGPRLKNSSGDLDVRNSDDSAFVEVQADTFKAASDTAITFNSDAANTGADWPMTLARPSTGMTAAVDFVLPATAGTSGQVLGTDGTGVLDWVSAGNTGNCLKVDSTTIAFGDSSPVALMTLPENAIIDHVDVIVDTPFDGTPTVTVGIAGDTAKYMGSTLNRLGETAVWRSHPGIAPVGTTEAIIATYSDGGATAGSARVVIAYAVPA